MKILDKDALGKMSVEALEKLSYEATETRQGLIAYARTIQQVMGAKIEQERISKLLGRDVQLVTAKGIVSGEASGNPGAA